MVQHEDGTSIITAKWAREKVSQILYEKVNTEISKIEGEIQIAVKKSEMSCTISNSLDDLTIKTFETRGFEMKYCQGYGQLENDYYIIKW
jgi:hypothetical protein